MAASQSMKLPSKSFSPSKGASIRALCANLNIERRIGRRLLLALICWLMITMPVWAQRQRTNFAPPATPQPKRQIVDKFRQLDEVLPTPNVFRAASGAPGAQYWQQRADYEIEVELDDENQRIIGSEKITYHNYSPDSLSYLWLQLDPNIYRPKSISNLSRPAPEMSGMSFDQLKTLKVQEVFDGGVEIGAVKDEAGSDLRYAVVDTMMRVDLAAPLAPGESTVFSVAWQYAINDTDVLDGRTGFEFFPEDGNRIYEVAQWFPRLCAYTDYSGWTHKQYLGRGEFTLELGNYVVKITAPNDHVVASTGVLLNPTEVLSEAQRERLEQAKAADKPVFIVTPEEAKENEKSKPTGKKTWIFKANDVRDFAFASSRKFIWDAMQHNSEGNQVMAMSYYPKEGEPLWSKYSTHAIIHTLNVYSRYTFKYPYPVAISVNGPIGGMEYPMICFNGPRPEKDGTYSAATKYGLISVVIHEVGHNYFPMIVNSDERQWTWMDEGINTFLQYLAEQEWEEHYPSQRGEPQDIVGYMLSSQQVPIMTQSDSVWQFGPNAYSKPATALNILRETVMGRELFDFSFREYARRWRFKRPNPADFFRTMEDASGVDLDWFWRGWFYSTDHCDLAITDVRVYNVNNQDPEIQKEGAKEARDKRHKTNSSQRNAELTKRANEFPELKDFYNEFDPLLVTEADQKAYQSFREGLSEEERALLDGKEYFHVLEFKNVGGLVMPIIIDAEYEDGSVERFQFPAEIWRMDSERVSRLIITDKPIKSVVLDPILETADADLSNNYYPPRIQKSRFQLFKSSRERSNEMQRAGLGKKPEPKPDDKTGNAESSNPNDESKKEQADSKEAKADVTESADSGSDRTKRKKPKSEESTAESKEDSDSKTDEVKPDDGENKEKPRGRRRGRPRATDGEQPKQ
jgi:Peptidase family M1 domain